MGLWGDAILGANLGPSPGWAPGGFCRPHHSQELSGPANYLAALADGKYCKWLQFESESPLFSKQKAVWWCQDWACISEQRCCRVHGLFLVKPMLDSRLAPKAVTCRETGTGKRCPRPSSQPFSAPETPVPWPRLGDADADTDRGGEAQQRPNGTPDPLPPPGPAPRRRRRRRAPRRLPAAAGGTSPAARCPLARPSPRRAATLGEAGKKRRAPRSLGASPGRWGGQRAGWKCPLRGAVPNLFLPPAPVREGLRGHRAFLRINVSNGIRGIKWNQRN